MNYISLQKRQLLDSLENQARFSQLMAVVIGDRGIGKSLVARQLIERLAGDLLIAPVEASIDLSQAQLEKTIRLQLGLPWQDSDHSIGEALHTVTQKRSLLVIDDAHLLSENCLNFLLSLVLEETQQEEGRLFVMLLGEASLASKLAQTHLLGEHPELCVVLEIEPLSESEVLPLIAEFQAMNTELAQKLFPPQRLSYFYQLSKGNPAELKAQLSRWMEARNQLPQNSRKTPSGRQVTIYLLLALFFFGLVYFQSELSEWAFGDKKPVESAGLSETNNPRNAGGRKSLHQAEPESAAKEVSPLKTGKPQIEVDSSKNAFSPQATLTDKTGSQEDATQPQAANSLNRQSETKDEASKEVSLTPGNQQAKTSSPQISQPQKPVSEVEPGSEITGSRENEPAKKDPKASETKTEKGGAVREASEAAGTANKNAGLSDDEAWLVLQDSAGFTLQWAALSQRSAATQLRQQLSAALPEEKFYLVRKRSGEKILWLVISGQYPDKDRATRHGLRLASRLKNNKPWAKSLLSVQKGLPHQEHR